MLQHVEKIKHYVEGLGITFTTLHPNHTFDYLMFDKPVNGGEHYGYSWCGLSGCRWGTEHKIRTINDYFKNEPEHIQLIGIAADEKERVKDAPRKRYPLVEWGITEAECLEGCYAHGYDWGGLYEHLDRVSCKFCGLKNLKELRNIYEKMPEVWSELRQYQLKTDRPYRKNGHTVFDLEKRFELEKEYLSQNKSIKTKAFFDELRRVIEVR